MRKLFEVAPGCVILALSAVSERVLTKYATKAKRRKRRANHSIGEGQ
jgi:hypothetical protein